MSAWFFTDRGDRMFIVVAVIFVFTSTQSTGFTPTVNVGDLVELLRGGCVVFVGGRGGIGGGDDGGGGEGGVGGVCPVVAFGLVRFGFNWFWFVLGFVFGTVTDHAQAMWQWFETVVINVGHDRQLESFHD